MIPEAEPDRSQFTVKHRLAAVKGCAPLNYGLVDGVRFPTEAPNYFQFKVY